MTIKWLFFLISFSLFSCKSVSISLVDKGSTPEEWKTFSVKTLEINAPNCPLNYAVQLSESLKDGIQNNTRLSINTNIGEGEVYIEGNINQYEVTPIAVQNNNNAAQNRLTINVLFNIFISEPKKEEMSFKIARFSDFEATSNLSEVEAVLLDDISKQIVQDVINKLLSNW